MINSLRPSDGFMIGFISQMVMMAFVDIDLPIRRNYAVGNADKHEHKAQFK